MANTAPTIDDTAGGTAARMTWPRALLMMTRPAHIALILVIFSNGVLVALWHGAGGNAVSHAIWPALALLVMASAAVHLANEAADHETDRLTRRTPFSGGSGALVASGLSPRLPLALGVALGIATTALTIGGVMVSALPPMAAGILLVGLGGGLAYSLPPLALARRGWGEPLNAVLGAWLLPLFGVATIASGVTVADAVAFLPFVAVTFASVLATAWPDRAADAATGKSTLQVRLAPALLRRIARMAFVVFLLGTGLSVAFDAMPLAVLGLLVVPLLVVGLRSYTRTESALANVAAMVGLAAVTLITLLASLAWDARAT